ncbi:MAG: carboxypeptidase regulatory-like domain-containing protein, partial [Chloroflexi bacterium]|nr:carboxypeptidase regulatory-like domain-containing protein [Chloroflexota bacterium]
PGPQGPAGQPGASGSPGAPGGSGLQGLQGAPGAIGLAGMSSGVVEGTVLLNASGKGAAKASVATIPGSVTATTDVDGKFKLDSVPIGQYTLTATLARHNAASMKVVVTAGKVSTATLFLIEEEPFQLISLRGAGYRLGTKDTYPGGQLRLTTHYALAGQPLTHGENLITTSGMSNVAVGSYVFPQARDADEAGKKLTGFSWAVVGPGESKVPVDGANTQTPRFKAEKTGRYEVILTATIEDGKNETSSLEVYASSYIGAQACITCHSGSVMFDQLSTWQQTGHATKLQDTYNSYTPERDYCIACHTTGYDEADKANGFDDQAKLMGWDPSKRSLTAWLKENGATVDQIMASPLGKLANVQCEACHGPGQLHQGIINSKENGTLFSPGVCSQCHPQEVQWKNSGHSKTGAANVHTAEGASCVACHTGQGFVEVKARGKQPVFPNMATPDLPATLAEPGEQPPVACATCHDPHAFAEPFDKGTSRASLQLRMYDKVTMPNGITVDAKESALCVSCHADKRDLAYKAGYSAGKYSRGAHDDTQADVFYGATPAVFDFGAGNYASSPHATLVKESCISCHMAPNPPVAAGADGKQGTSDDVKGLNIGGHSWNMAGDYSGKKVENLAACTTSGCHAQMPSFDRTAYADYDGNGKVEGIQTEIDGLLKVVADKLPKEKAGAVLASVSKDNTTELQRQALWNYAVIKNDGSRGVHNTAFSVQVLQRTYKQLTGQNVPGAALR